MPSISGPNLTKLRASDHKSELFLSVCPARVLWSARVNNAAIETGAYAIAFDGGTGLSFAAVGEWQEVWVGSTAGAYDKGRFRIKSITSGDSGVTGTVNASLNSIPFADNDFLTFILWYLPKPRRPRLESDGTFLKDGGASTGGVAYTNQNEESKPVTIAGENRAGFLDGSGEFVIESQLPDSYATAEGATIASYSATAVYPTTGVSISINSGTGVGTVTFTAAGHYWIKWRSVDSNGVGQDTYRWYAVYDAANYPEIDFTLGNLTADWNNGGCQAAVTMNDNATLAELPDFAPAIIWQRSYYQDALTAITHLPDNSSTLINGYLMRSRFDQPLQDGVKTVDFTIATVNAVMAETYNFSVSLEAVSGSPTAWYQYGDNLTAGLAVHHFLSWHTTILQTCDIFGLVTGNTNHRIAYAEFEDGTIWNMPDSFLRDRSIRHHLVCDNGGRVHMVPDVQLLTDAERGALATVADLENSTNLDKSTVTLIHEPGERTPYVHVSGFAWDGTFDGEGNPNATPFCAISPGDNPNDRGASVASLGRQTFGGGSHAAQIAGRFYSVTNNEFPELRVDFHGNYWGVLSPAYAEFWTMSLLSTQTGRAVIWAAKKLILRNVSARIESGLIRCTAVFEPEAPAQGGQVVTCPSYPELGGETYEIPEGEEAGGGLITAGSVYRLPPLSLDWTLETAEATNDLLVDPNWHATKVSVDSSLATVWRCGVGYIKKSEDGGQTWEAVTPGNPPNDAADSPAPTAGNVTFTQIDADHSTSGKFIALARWQNAADDWRTWYCYTDDHGDTWTWVSIATGGGGGSPLNIESGYSALAHTGWTIKFCWLTDTTFVVVYNDGTDLMAKIGTVSGTAISYGTEYTKNVTGLCDSVNDVVRLTDTTFAVSWNEAGSNAYVTCGTNSSGVITWGTTDTDSGNSALGYLAVLSSTLIVLGVGTTARAATVSGSGSSLAVTFGTAVGAGAGGNCVAIAALSSTSFVWLERATTREAVVGTVSGTTIAFGTPVQVHDHPGATDEGSVVGLSATQFVTLASSAANLYANVCSVSGTTITAGTETAIASTSPDNMGAANRAVKLSSSTFAVVYYKANTYYVNAFDNTLTALFTADSVAAETAFGGFALSASTGGSLAFLYLNTAETDETISIVTYDLGGGGYDAKGYGVAIDKSGLYYYLTVWIAGDTVHLVIIDASDDSVAADVSLGSATVSQLDAGTYSAFVYTPLDFSVDCYVFGRMASPAGLSGDHHVIAFDSDGAPTAVISGWGSERAGALVDDGTTLFVIRNGASAKLYDGEGTLLSTLPFAAVNPHALTLDSFNSVLYAANAAAGATMVVKSLSPYSSWVDITYAHGTAAGVKAVALL